MVFLVYTTRWVGHFGDGLLLEIPHSISWVVNLPVYLETMSTHFIAEPVYPCYLFHGSVERPFELQVILRSGNIVEHSLEVQIHWTKKWN